MYIQGLILTLILASILLAILFVVQRRMRPIPIERSSPKSFASKLGRGMIYVLRLLGFTFFAIILIGGSVMLFVDYQALLEDTAPTPSHVEIPPDLPFQVEEITFIGGDYLTMAGWYVPPHNGATIILLHGYEGNRTAMLWHASVLVNAGYGVLLYDERASGESGGDHRSYGWEDAKDVGGALEFLNSRSIGQSNKIGIAGCSIGMQIAMQGAAYYPQIGAVWGDGPSMITGRDMPHPTNWALGMYWVSNYVMDWMMERKLNIQAPPAMIDIIGMIEPRPVMLVAGGKPHPSFGPESILAFHFARYGGENVMVWVIPEAYHCDGPVLQPEEYNQRMVNFFNSAFGIK